MARRASLIVEKDETLPVRSGDDVVRVRREVRAHAIEAGFSLVDQTKMVTAASEIARNTIDYGGGGIANLEPLLASPRRGLRLIFEDKGPGISDIQQAMTDHFTTGNGLGLGLGGARR